MAIMTLANKSDNDTMFQTVVGVDLRPSREDLEFVSPKENLYVLMLNASVWWTLVKN